MATTIVANFVILSSTNRVTVETQTFWKSKFYELKLASCRYNQDSPRTCEGMNETRKIEELANEPIIERTSDAENLRDNEENDETAVERNTSADSSDCKSAKIADRRDSVETSPKLSNLDPGKLEKKFTNFLYNFSLGKFSRKFSHQLVSRSRRRRCNGVLQRRYRDALRFAGIAERRRSTLRDYYL